MIIRHEATLDETAEPSVRLYQQSKTYSTNRWLGALLCAGMFAVFAFLGFNAKENVNLAIICPAAAAWGAGLFVIAYPGTIRRRVRSYLSRELKGPWPCTATYEITGGKLLGAYLGVRTSFALADFTTATEDGKYLQLTFGPHGLCVIPLRAFDSTDEKNAFLAALRA